jgi:hypothetical protein
MLIGHISITVFGAFFPQPTHMPCTECGASLAREQAAAHACDPERQLDFRLFHLRDEIAAFDEQFSAWLTTARGRFALWLADHGRR